MQRRCARCLYERSTARPFAVCVFAAEVDTQYVFGVVGHHTKECGYPHPEHGARATDADRGGNAGNVTGSYRCGKSGTKRLEGRDRAFFLTVLDNVLVEKATQGVLEPESNVRHLKEFGENGNDNTGTNEQEQSKGAPNHAVNLTVYALNRL